MLCSLQGTLLNNPSYRNAFCFLLQYPVIRQDIHKYARYWLFGINNQPDIRYPVYGPTQVSMPEMNCSCATKGSKLFDTISLLHILLGGAHFVNLHCCHGLLGQYKTRDRTSDWKLGFAWFWKGRCNYYFFGIKQQLLPQYVIGYWFLSNRLQDLLAQSVPTNHQLGRDSTNQSGYLIILVIIKHTKTQFINKF